MSDDDVKLLEHQELVRRINSRIENIHKELCEYEESIDTSSSEDMGDATTKIMDILETLDDIHEAAQVLRPYNLNLRTKQQALEDQIKALEQSVNILQLEKGSVSNDE